MSDLQEEKEPSKINTLNNSDKQKLSKKYAAIHNKLFLVDIILTIVGVLVLIVGGMGGISGRISALLSMLCPNIWLKNGVYVVVISVLYSIYTLPLSFYSGYILEHRFKLSNQNILAWFKDKLKGFCVSLIISLLLLEVMYFLLRKTGDIWWVWAGFLWILFSLVLNKIAPILLIPIFFKLTPLNNVELADKLKKMAEKVGAKVIGIFEIDFSKKTKKANAAFTGIGSTRRILLADTLLKEFLPDEIEVILAHELGHYYYKHLWKLLLLGVVSTFFGLWIGHLILTGSSARLGFASISDIGTFPVLSLVLFCFMLVTMPVNNIFSRRLERQADRFALETTDNADAFVRSMNKLAMQNLADINPNPIIHFLLHSHPSISERIKMAEKYKK
jgi:STE24 endopeptidase